MRAIKISLFLFVLMTGSLMAQTITVTNRSEVATGKNAFYPVFNLKGDKLLFSSDSYIGLSMYDLSAKSVENISDEPGAGYEPIFDASESKIFYRKTSYDNRLRKDAIECFDIANNKKTLMLSPQRNLKQVRNFKNGFVVTADRNLLKSTFGKSQEALPVYVTTHDLKIYLYKGEKFQQLNPLNETESRYLWVSLSPDAQKILFTAAGKGTFVCDLNGKITASLGYLNAPVWYDDKFVVGMQDKDDGHVVTASKIIMTSLDGKAKKEISASDEIAMYPTTAASVAKIAYNTLDGKIKIAAIQIK